MFNNDRVNQEENVIANQPEEEDAAKKELRSISGLLNGKRY